MDEKKRRRQKSLVSRLQLTPENTEVPHMVKGMFIKPEQASVEDVPAVIPSDLRTAVYRAEGSKKHKVKTEEGKMGFGYVFSKIHKEKTKPIVGQPTELTEWDQHQSMKERLSLVPLHEESSYTTDVSTGTSIESKGESEKSEILPVSTQLSCHKRTCMKFQAGYDHKIIREKKSPCYDKTEPIIEDVVSHILRLRDRLGWETSLPRRGFVAKPANLANFQKFTLPKAALQKDDGEFVYCLIRSRNDPKAAYDPYDLQVVSANMAKQSKEYWTVTASYVSKFTSVCGKEEMEIIPVIEWLCERQIYYALRSIDICFNFRKKKYFTIWKSNVKRSKIMNSKMLLYKRLFFADEILQKCLLYIQALCEDVSSTEKHKLSEDNAISFIKIDTSHTYTLDEFCEKQYKQSQQALTQLQDFKDKVIKVIQSSFLKIAEMKGAEKLFQYLPDDTREKPKHFEIAGWRHIMEDFARFLQLVDIIFQELLRRLVHNALNLLLEIFKGSDNMTVSKLKTNEDLIWSYKKTIARANSLSNTETRHQQMFQANYFEILQESPRQSKKPVPQREIITVGDIDKILEDVKRQLEGEEEYVPIFEINICLRIPYEKELSRKYIPDDDDDYIPETSLVPFNETLEDEDLKQLSQCDRQSRHEGLENSMLLQSNISTDEKNISSRTTTSKSHVESLKYQSSPAFATDFCLVPNRRVFSVQLQGIVDGLENIIDQVLPFSQDPQLSIFSTQSLHKIMQPLETSMHPEQVHYLATWPNCELILGTDPDYQSKILSLLSLQSCSLGRVESYSRNFFNFCNMVDKAKNTTDTISALIREMSTTEFRSILENYTADIKEIVCMITEKNISMFRVKSFNFQMDCLPYFEALIEIILCRFYAAIDAKNVHLVEVTRTAVAKLSKELQTVDEFIEHLLYLHQISVELPEIKIQYNSLSELYFIAKDYDIFLPLQQLALYQTVVRTLQNLQSTILICEKMKDDYVIKFNEGLAEYIDNLQAELRDYKNKVRNPVLLLRETLPKMANEIIESLIEEAADINEKILNYANYQTVFDSSVSDMKSTSLEKMSHGAQSGDYQRATAELSEIESDLVLRKLLWDSRQEWSKLFFMWKHTIFWNLDVDLIQRDVNRFMQIVQILEKGLPENTILPAMKKSLYEFKEFLPIIIALRNPCLQPRHWETIQNIVKQTIIGDKRLTLEKILEFNMFQYRKEINEVSVTATNEATLEAMLKKIMELWSKTDFHLSQYRTETSATFIISSAEDIIALLEDSQVTISTIKGSCFIGPIKSLVEAWDRKLNLFSCTLEEWLNCQRNWIYLEPIFCAPEIRRQLPEESNLFSQVDNKWKDIMKHTEENPNAIRAATTAGVFETLQTSNAHLEKIQKALEDYLEVKRMVFPRFYFLSNAELIDILADSKNHDVVQPHLVKCFANIRKLYIRPQEKRPPVVLMIRSAEGEILLMPKHVRIRGPAELWLGNVENTMYDMVRKFITVGIAEWNQMEFKEWFFTHPGQVILLVSQIMFSRACEMCLSSSYAKMEMTEGRDDLINLIEQLAEIASDILSYHKQSTLEALVTLFTHCRDVMTVLIDNEICSAEDFAWTRQLRYEWHDVNPCKVIQGYASFEYGFEYLGCSPRLVITPLTDRCWLTVTGALQLNLGGCLSGPAGTGKTETVKDLSKALGKLCLVFNCSEGLDDKVMGKLLCGLVQSGAWCCFDEFNRIDVEVLSAIASQMQAIKAAKDSCTVRFVLEGKEVRLKPFCAIFITMNPGYKGRVELPDNLKSLFRPVSMMVPDYELIAEIMLCSEGFRSAKSLSEKIVNLYHLSSKQLSHQDHYDFGMRAIKTVLIRAGQKRQELKTHYKKKKFSSSEETLIITSVLKEVNLPKFLAEDVPLFEGILTDLFPGMKIKKKKPRRLQKAISVAIQHLRLQTWENQIEKVIQFYNQIMACVGVMLVGPTGGGKTTIRTILEKAMTILPLVDTESGSKLDAAFQNSSKKGKIDTFVINPKCVTLGELFGETNPNTMEWSDGLLSSAVRTFAKLSAKKPKKKDPSTTRSEMQDLYTLNTVNLADASLKDEGPHSTENIHSESITDWQWIILDGPVDPVWIENLNSVLDDSRVLCLPNSERIYLSPGIRMIFEVDSLSQASPATVSRCAMVYVDPVDLGWEPYVSTWLEGFSELLAQNDIEYLSSLFHSSVRKGMDFLNEHKKFQPFPVHQMGIVMNICRILDSFLQIMMQRDTLQLNERRMQSSVSLTPTFMRASPKLTDVASGVVPSVLKKRQEQIWFWEKQPNNMMLMLGKLYIFAFTWAVGGILKREEEHEGETLIGIYTSHDDLVTVTQDFDYLVHEIFERKPPANIHFPSDNKTVFDYFVDLRTGEFEPWANLVPSTQYLIQKETAGRTRSDKAEKDEEKKIELSTFIPNIDTIRHQFLISLLLLNKHPVLIIGDPGSGKTTMVENMLQKLQKQGGLNMKMGTILGDVLYYREATKTSLMKNFSNRSGTSRSSGRTPPTSAREILSTLSSPREEPDLEETCTSGAIISTLQLGAHTSAAQTKAWILQKLILKSKDILGAPQFKQVLLFIDDLNAPIAEEYGSQPPLELIRQFFELGGFYDTQQLTWKHVQDVAMVATCTPPSEGSNEMSARLLTCFCTLVLPVTSLQSLQRIFQVRLGAYFYIKRFMAEVQKCKDYLTCASIAVYYRMLLKVRPTPAKCHYTFNLRDLFKVLEGLLQAHKSVIVSKESIVLLFVHECTRVFHDRLMDSPEREVFFQILSSEVNNYFKIHWTKEELMEEPPIFVDFLDSNQPVNKRVYRNVTNKNHLLWVLEEQCIKMQAISPQGISMVFFKEAVQHITRAARIFRQEGSHMTLVGHGGTGKVTYASLACYLSACSLYRLSISRNYTYGNFREDLKAVCRQTGLEGKRTVFLITESDLIQEAFLEDLSCILKSGQVPNLFEKDELDNIVVSLVSVAEKAKYSNAIDDIYAFFLQILQRCCSYARPKTGGVQAISQKSLCLCDISTRETVLHATGSDGAIKSTLQKVHSNLHIVLTTSHAGLTFRQCCRMYPATINCCTVDWYDTWPEEALCHVAQSYFKHDDSFQNQNLSVLVQICVNIHKNVSFLTEKYLKETKRHYYITPNSYLQFINTFSTILKSMKEKIMSDRTCYHSGLTKILEATSQITVMQNELLVLGPQIEAKTKEIEELVEKLHKDALVVEQVRAIVKQDEEIMAAETCTVEEYAQQATDELNAVMPTLEKAVAALDALDKNHIAEIRVYARPPPLVLTVMNAVCVLLQKKPNWATAKLLLADPGFLKRLVNLDKDNLPEKVFLQLKKYVRMPDFNPLKVGLVSVACCSMCQWVLALDNYHLVQKFVEPKQMKVAEAEELLKLAHEKLAEKQRSLALIEHHQQNLERKFAESIEEQEMLAARKDQTTRRLHSASVLSTALKDEMERWKESVNSFDQRLQGIMGDAFISAACIAYSGVLSASYRQQLVNDCLNLCEENNIPVSPNYSLVNCMTEKNEVRKWQNAGLPLDQYSTENAIHIMYGQRYPLLIDPERQAYKWISQMSGKLRQIRVTDPRYFRILENSMRLGESVLLQDFSETLDSNMKPILKREIYNKAGQDFIRIGDSEIEYNQNFRLYLTTQKPNPHFLPAICSIVTMINFTVTFEGLQDQLLSAVLIKEKPEVEHQRCELLESIAADLITLRELEQKSLRLLQKTDGHILDDGDLIDNLQRSKITSTEIFERVEASAATEVKIDALRKSYLPIATRGAILYFVVSELSYINYMYQFSLEWFHKIFEDSIERVHKLKIGVSLSVTGVFKPQPILRTQSERLSSLDVGDKRESSTDNFQGHINNIIEKLTRNVYKRVSSALFSENQLCFTFMMCTAIMKNKYDGNPFTNKLGFIPENQWNFFLQSNIMANIMDTQDSEKIGSHAFKKTPPLHWVTDMMWKECRYMSTYMPAFSLLCDSLSTNSQQWRAFLNSRNVYYLISTGYRPVSPRQALTDPGLEVLRESDDQGSGPSIFPWQKLSAFERLILIKVLRLESLTSAVQAFITEKLGKYYLQIGGINLKAIYEEESNSITPIILIHTQGVDIAALFLRLAQEIKGTTQHVKMISLGRGQGSKAEDMVYKSSILQEQWVFLQNCHLAASFMPRLCKIVESFTRSQTNIDPQFRLWLSSTPDPSFPVPILRKGLKIVIEPPHGLKGTLLQTFGVSGTEIVTEAVFNNTTCGPSWKRLLFSLCFFSAVVHERKKYGALGWNIPYEFNSSDLEISIRVLEILLQNQKKIPWEAMRYMTGEVTYGGRVTDNWDRRCILSILDNFYNPSVLQEDFTYTTDWVYQPISAKDTLKDCRAYLRSLPESDSPELFGMHQCAERAYQKSQAQLLIESIARTQPAISADSLIICGRKTQDEIVLEIASDIQIRLPLTVEDMGQTPETESKEKVTFESFKSGSVWAALAKVAKGPSSFTSSTLLVVLRQEIKQYNHLLSIIMQSLHALQQGIKGEIIFTTVLEELYNSILKNKVPELWQQQSNKSHKPLGSWIDDLVIRVTFFSMWAKQVITFMESRYQYLVTLQKLAKRTMQPAEELDPFEGSSQAHPSCFWLPGFFFPQGFLTAVLQNYARKKELPVDSLTFIHKVLPFVQDEDQSLRFFNRKAAILNKAFKESSWHETGVTVCGLYIDGACWNPTTKALEEPELHQRFYPLPDIHFLPKKMAFHARLHCLEEEVGLLYECPLYRTPERSGTLSSTGISTNFITVVNLPSLIAPSHWITRGVALLCQLDD